MTDLVPAEPEVADILRQAETLAEAGDTEAALPLVRTYLDLKPDDRIGLGLLARCIGEADPVAAGRIMQTLLERDPDDIFAQRGLAYYRNVLNLRQYHAPGAGVFVDGPWAHVVERPDFRRSPQRVAPVSPTRRSWRWWAVALIVLLLALVALMIAYLYDPSIFTDPTPPEGFVAPFFL